MCMRGDIYYVDFGSDTSSCVQSGTRPAVVVSNNTANRYSPVITVLPLTAKTHKRRNFPTHVYLPQNAGFGLSKNSMALAEQIISIDKSKLINKVGEIHDAKTLESIDAALRIQLGVEPAISYDPQSISAKGN
ncbi:MAG: type II toxin-antitoxin system PemK/MazF family toxin [Lachnospiraceae bacterium]|nr:type II toxin-antitoxin system PemK/MazF family toxin [Lachnospiraceae bacterium]